MDILFEFLMNALRLREGFSFDLFEQRTGIARNRLLDRCRSIDDELLVITDSGLAASTRGFDFLNDLLQKFIES